MQSEYKMAYKIQEKLWIQMDRYNFGFISSDSHISKNKK